MSDAATGEAGLGAARAFAARAHDHVQKREWRAALDSARSATALAPATPACTAIEILALQQLKQLDAAELLVARARAQWPDHRDIALRHAHMATLRRDWSEALERWRQVGATHPENPTICCGIAVALRELGHIDESDALLAQAIERFPEHMLLQANLARNATRARRWSAALERWEVFRERFGDVDLYYSGRGQALAGQDADRLDQGILQHDDEAAAAPAGDIAMPPVAGDNARLLKSFQGIGEDCEFGLVQRRVGLEPLGLLRFARTSTDDLLTMLLTRFSGVGEAPFLEIYEEVDGEYWIRDRRFGMNSHTTVFAGQADRATFETQMSRRLCFLRDQFMSGLARGSRILVHRTNTVMRKQRVYDLYDTLARYGPNWLVHVGPPEPDLPAGRVVRLRDRLIHGAVAPSSSPDLSAWIAVCLGALALKTLHDDVCRPA